MEMLRLAHALFVFSGLDPGGEAYKEATPLGG